MPLLCLLAIRTRCFVLDLDFRTFALSAMLYLLEALYPWTHVCQICFVSAFLTLYRDVSNHYFLQRWMTFNITAKLARVTAPNARTTSVDTNDGIFPSNDYDDPVYNTLALCQLLFFEYGWLTRCEIWCIIGLCL